MTEEQNAIIPVTVEYITSSGKWRGIRRFAEVNGLDGIDKIDAMIRRIESVGDACISDVYTMEFLVIEDYLDYMFNVDGSPCPHCCNYKDCRRCPMFDGIALSCCQEWNNAKDIARDVVDDRFTNLYEESTKLEELIAEDSDLKHSFYVPTVKSLARRKFRNDYDSDKAIISFVRLVNEATLRHSEKVYGRCNGRRISSGRFPKRIMRRVAIKMLNDFEERFAAGEYDGYKQKYLM